MKKIWFTGDPHYGHFNIIKYCKRPFATVEEMDSKLIANHNSVVSPDDDVYILGDIAFSNPAEYIGRLNGRKFLIRGNHDKHIDECRPRVVWIRDLTQINILGQKIVLCHYAMRVWANSHHGSWHLYGHSHGTLPDDPNALSLDVGVDCHGYFPVSFEQIKGLMAKKKFKPVDQP